MIIHKLDDGSLTDVSGTPIKDRSIDEYVKGLVIPPAYKNVRIFHEANPKIVFEGTDSKGRLQQIYSKKWRSAADKKKFQKLIEFGKKLPAIFRHIEQNIKGKKLTRDKCISIILKIISVCYFRVGNQKYESLYSSYGISTIKKHHIYLHPDSLDIRFIGKKGVLNECFISSPDLVATIKELIKSKKPNDYVFTYANAELVRATEINDYLKKYDEEFTSKMFRTFDTNTLLIDFLRNRGAAFSSSPAIRKKNIVAAMKEISKCVNNTPAICKKSYSNADLMDMYLSNPIKWDRAMPIGQVSSRELFIKFLESYFAKK